MKTESHSRSFGRQTGRIVIVSWWLVSCVSAGHSDQGASRVTASGLKDEAARAFVAVPDNATAWKHLPPAEKGEGEALPPWARALAPTLPRTAAALLELDYLHRVKNPLDSLPRAKLRWAVARANACEAGEIEALFDLRQAGLDDGGVKALTNSAGLNAADNQLLAFARKLTLDSQAVTDAEVAELIKRHGDRQVVAMVQHIAYANFQDRLLLGLGLGRHSEPPVPAAELRFTRPDLGARFGQPRPLRVPAPPLAVRSDLRWSAVDIATLRMEIERQKTRRPRIALARGHEAAVHWGELCRTYQPELARAWTYSMWAFGAEALQEPVLEASVLWVVTRTQSSFY